MKWLGKLLHMRGQKSMLLWAKRQYHEAYDGYKMDARCFPKDGAVLACDIARVQTWEEVLYYLTQDEQWLE
jgi:hypothetical protein